jgi:hypothetical protein
MTNKLKTLLCTCLMTLCSLTGVVAQVERGNTGDVADKNDKDAPVNNPTPVKIIEKVVGTWEASGIFNGNKNVTDTDTVGLNRSFEFTRENKYLSYSDREQIDSGTYKLNEVQNILYLESAAGNEVVEYNVSFDDETMTLQPTQSSAANSQRFRYVYTRKSEGARRK